MDRELIKKALIEYKKTAEPWVILKIDTELKELDQFYYTQSVSKSDVICAFSPENESPYNDYKVPLSSLLNLTKNDMEFISQQMFMLELTDEYWENVRQAASYLYQSRQSR
jgi:hypothetical protein